MKKIISIFAFAALAAAVLSCTKSDVDAPASQDGTKLYANLLSGNDASKVALNPSTYSQTWQSGDQILLYQPAETPVKGNLSTEGSGASASFEGSLEEGSGAVTAGEACYFVTPYESVTAAGAENITLNVLRDQTGDIADFGTHYISYSEGVQPAAAEGGWSFTSSKAMKNLCPVLKMNVAADLDVRRIDVCGYNGTSARHFAGTFYFNPATEAVTATSDAAWKYDVRVKHSDGSEISGDIYFVCKPSVANDVTSLKFTFTNEAGTKREFTKDLSTPLVNGQVRDLGNITKITWPTELPATTFSVQKNENTAGIILLANTESGVSFYYTTDGSEPTTESTAYDSAAGIAVTETEYIRVLTVKEGFTSTVTNAYVRYYYTPTYTSATTETVSAGGTYALGFATLTNTGSADMELKFATNNLFTPGSTTDYKISATTLYAGKGTWYCKFYYNNNKTSARTRGVNVSYNSVTYSKTVSVAKNTKFKSWLGPDPFDIAAGNEISFTLTDAQSIYGFILLEYGFEWPETKGAMSVSSEALSGISRQ